LNIKNNQNSSILLIVIVVIALFALLYQSYLSYVKYEENHQVVDALIVLNKIDTVLDDIAHERTSSAVYMGTNHKGDLDKLKQERKAVDEGLEDILELLSNNSNNLKYQLMIEDITHTLLYTRNRVNVLSMDYAHTLFDNYASKVATPLIEMVNSIVRSSSIPNSYFELFNIQENLYAENSFITFLLSGQKEMNTQDLLIWEHFLDEDILPNEKLNYLRGEIFINSSTGDYGVSLKDWDSVYREKSSTIKKMEHTIISTFKNGIDETISNLKYQMFKYLLASMALFIIIVILLSLYKRGVQNSRLLIDTLSDLESDLNEQQRAEIKEVLKTNDTIAIYRFLVNAIKEPSRAKDHFLANMSHEIRTPLNGIIGFTNILKGTELEEDQKEFLAIIEESSNNLIAIVDDILDFSKVASGKIEIENIAFNVMEKFEASIDSYAAKASQKNIDLNLMIDPNLPTELIGDATKISQVIINLLSNAVKFTDEGGTIDIRIEQIVESHNVVTLKFSIKDSGIGMTPIQQEKVFDAFSQADVSTSRKFGGTGLGLTISKKFVSLMGGALALESKEGEGTTFFFSLDLEKSSTATQREGLTVTHLNAVYVTVPNREGINENLQRYIEYHGANFRTESYVDILAMHPSELPDIIFIDHHYIKDEEIISALARLETKTILISTAEIEKCNCNIKDNISKVLYKPVNFSKVVRSLKLVHKNTDDVSSDITEVDDIRSNRVFTDISALVVEDNSINQKLLKNILTNFDITVTIANNGLEALNLRKENRYDIIFMDIQMSVMDGVESTQKILEYESSNEQSHVPIIALTANTLASDRDKYIEIGMDRYLKKPIDVADLTAIIEEYFPIREIRDSIPFEGQTTPKEGVAPCIILYKETDLTAKIYTAVLNNLGYSVDMYSSMDTFLDNIDKRSYKFGLFDIQPFKRINSENFVVDLIRESGITPIAFVENEKESKSDYCETLKSVGHANEISEKLRNCG